MEYIALMIALYGAVLATFVAVKDWLAGRTSVFVSYGWVYTMEGLANHAPPDQLLLTAVNDGRRDVVVGTFTLELPDLGRVTPAFFAGQQPRSKASTCAGAIEGKRLAPGDSVQVKFDGKAVRALVRQKFDKGPVELRGVLEDSLENHYFSSSFEVGE